MTTPDDLPWPELGNVSRGATRGNQGQKGALGPPDRDGRSILQLRVQPGVLAVRLNRQASDWYRTLDNEVNRALKLTKTYWRKARRRQDYDARADQDHMELHEWLQQLKDKTMSHLELLMQKGDIQGPPYTMPDDIELTFLRKFIERQSAGIPHNPRLRSSAGDYMYTPLHHNTSLTPENSETNLHHPHGALCLSSYMFIMFKYCKTIYLMVRAHTWATHHETQDHLYYSRLSRSRRKRAPRVCRLPFRFLFLS
jgi:hypothetical protein